MCFHINAITVLSISSFSEPNSQLNKLHKLDFKFLINFVCISLCELL